MMKQMEKVRKRENRTRSELMREAVRLYFGSRFSVYGPSRPHSSAENM